MASENEGWVRVHSDADEEKSDEEFLTRNLIRDFTDKIMDGHPPFPAEADFDALVNEYAASITTELKSGNLRDILFHFIKWIDHQNGIMEAAGVPRMMNEEYIVIGEAPTSDDLIGGLVDSFIELDPWAYAYSTRPNNEKEV